MPIGGLVQKESSIFDKNHAVASAGTEICGFETAGSLLPALDSAVNVTIQPNKLNAKTNNNLKMNTAKSVFVPFGERWAKSSA